jgi:hypothetical protein
VAVRVGQLWDEIHKRKTSNAQRPTSNAELGRAIRGENVGQRTAMRRGNRNGRQFTEREPAAGRVLS